MGSQVDGKRLTMIKTDRQFWDPNGQNVKHAELDLGDKAMSMDVDGRLLVGTGGCRH